MAPLIDPILRLILFVFSSIALGLIAAWVHGSGRPSSRVRFATFAPAFSLLFCVFWGIFVALTEFLAFPIIMAFFDFCNWVFLLTAGAAVATKIRCHSCGNHRYLDEKFDGSSKDCRLAQSGTAFLFFSFAVAAVLCAYSVIQVIRGGAFTMSSYRRRRTIPRTGVPTMSQV